MFIIRLSPCSAAYTPQRCAGIARSLHRVTRHIVKPRRAIVAATGMASVVIGGGVNEGGCGQKIVKSAWRQLYIIGVGGEE